MSESKHQPPRSANNINLPSGKENRHSQRQEAQNSRYLIRSPKDKFQHLETTRATRRPRRQVQTPRYSIFLSTSTFVIEAPYFYPSGHRSWNSSTPLANGVRHCQNMLDSGDLIPSTTHRTIATISGSHISPTRIPHFCVPFPPSRPPEIRTCSVALARVNPFVPPLA